MKEPGMGRMIILLVGIAIGAAGVYGSLNYHLIHTQDGFEAIPKTSATFNDTYVDVRSFGVGDWADHKDLVAALIAAKKESVMGEAAEGAFRDRIGNLFDIHR
jgi:hypothetical protein